MYQKVPVKKLEGSEHFKNSGNKLFTVLDFWKYGFSNLNSNVLRGVLAEFLVENALKNVDDINIRNPWGDYDVDAPNGIKVEVKCSSYLQDWDQNELSKIIWSGLKAKALYWSSAVNEQTKDEVADFKADVYVLALFKHQDPATLDILDLDQWCFYILPKEQIKEYTKNGNSISLAKLNKLGIKSTDFANLAKSIKKIS